MGVNVEKVTAYRCSFCKGSSKPKIFLSPSGCKKHEQRCWLNPVRKSCATCANLSDYHDKDKFANEWICMEKLAKPFKEKITDCVKWEASGTIFLDRDYD